MRKIIGKLTLATILIGTLVVGFFGLVLYNVKDMLFGAPFSVHTVTDGSTVTDRFLPITGKAKKAQSITINGNPVGINKNGEFSDGVLLASGYNIIEVAETDRFGKEKVRTIHIVASPSVSVAQNDVTPYQR